MQVALHGKKTAFLPNRLTHRIFSVFPQSSTHACVSSSCTLLHTQSSHIVSAHLVILLQLYKQPAMVGRGLKSNQPFVSNMSLKRLFHPATHPLPAPMALTNRCDSGSCRTNLSLQALVQAQPIFANHKYKHKITSLHRYHHHPSLPCGGQQQWHGRYLQPSALHISISLNSLLQQSLLDHLPSRLFSLSVARLDVH